MFCCISYYLSAFGTVWLPYETRCKTGRTSAKVRYTKSRRNFFATNAPDPPHWTLNSFFSVFRNVWVHLGPFRYCTKLGAKWAELVQLMQRFMPRSCAELFIMNAPDPHHWTLNSCFVAFYKVWVHLGLFRYCTKLVAKWAEFVQLMQKFMPRSRVGTFH